MLTGARVSELLQAEWRHVDLDRRAWLIPVSKTGKHSGVDLFAVGKVLGHADYKSTMRYSDLAHETLLSAVEAGASKLSAQWAT